jgi:hypothetical protein
MKMTCQTQMIFQVITIFLILDNNGNDANNTSNKGKYFFNCEKPKEKEDPKINRKEDYSDAILAESPIFLSLR